LLFIEEEEEGGGGGGGGGDDDDDDDDDNSVLSLFTSSFNSTEANYKVRTSKSNYLMMITNYNYRL
jgi:hypothetical protein